MARNEGHTRSVALGVTPKNAAEANERLKAHGITLAHYDMKTGDLIMESPQARKQCMKMHPDAVDAGAW
jgi:hypothetical protein